MRDCASGSILIKTVICVERQQSGSSARPEGVKWPAAAGLPVKGFKDRHSHNPIIGYEQLRDQHTKGITADAHALRLPRYAISTLIFLGLTQKNITRSIRKCILPFSVGFYGLFIYFILVSNT